MKRTTRVLLFLAAVTALPALFPGRAAAGDLEDARARGEKLFADASLGTSGMSCNSCHTKMGRGDKALTGRTPFPKVFSMTKRLMTLEEVVQGCLIGALKGSPLAWDDPRLTDLTLYVDALYQKK
jgi:cytochrome c